MSSRFASRRSFFYRRNANGIRLSDLRARLAQPKAHLAKQPLALTHAQLDAIALTQVLRQNGPIPQACFKSEVAWCLTQIRLNASPLRLIQRTRTSRPFTFPQALETATLETSDPSLNCRGRLTEQLAHFGARVTAAHQQNPVKAVVIPRFLASLDLLSNRQLHHLRVCNLELTHGCIPKRVTMQSYMLQYLCRYV